MNQELWSKFDKLRDSPWSGLDGLAEFFQKEGVRFESGDLGTWGQFLDSRIGSRSELVRIPEWLGDVFRELVKDTSPKAICDPWAGIGFLIAILCEACHPLEAFALTVNSANHALGKTLVPDVKWQLGEPLSLLESAQEFDAIASILPMGARGLVPLKITTESGGSIELRDDYGNLVLVAAARHLSSFGIGLFIVTPSFFFSPHSVFRQFTALGLSVTAALALPSGTFAPITNISSYLVVVRRQAASPLFVAELSVNIETNLQIVENLRHGREGSSLELGRIVDPQNFSGLDAIRIAERISQAERRFGAPAIKLGDLAIAINLGRFHEHFAFKPQDNALFIPLIGNSDVVESLGELTLKNQNYAQVVIDGSRSQGRFIARFLNSNFGKELRQWGKKGVIPKLNKQKLRDLPVLVPDLQTQTTMLAIEARITEQENALLGLQNELQESRRELWADSRSAPNVEKRLGNLSNRLGDSIKEHTAERLDQWFETLPFPLASILRAWQATPSQDFKTKYEHLLHFFEGTAEFLSVIVLSAFSSNEALFGAHKRKLIEVMQKQHLSFERATFGTWKLVVEYLGKQIRELLSENEKKPVDAQNDRAMCAEIFCDPSLDLPEALSRKELAMILSTTNKMRNDWSGHAGVVGHEEAKLRNEQLLAALQKLRETLADTWIGAQLIQALHCRPRRGFFDNEVAVLVGSNSEFLKETRAMATWLDVEHIYLLNIESGRALKLLPLVRVGVLATIGQKCMLFLQPLGERRCTFRLLSFRRQTRIDRTIR